MYLKIRQLPANASSLLKFILFILLGIAMTGVKTEETTSAAGTPNKRANDGGGTSPPPRNTKPNRWGNPKSMSSASFKGAIPELANKVFISGPTQATKYDEAYKSLTHYFGKKFNHRVFRAFEKKDEAVGLALLTKPKAPKVKKIVQVGSIGDNSVLTGEEKEVVDTDSENFLEYQLQLKQYVSDKSKYTDDLQKCFSMIIGQCSPAVEQNLEADDSYAAIKESSNSIELIKLLEKICYSYMAHEFIPLGAWDAIDKLSAMKQPDDVHEVKHYESFRSVTDMCKASTVNFALMCTANVDLAITTIKKYQPLEHSMMVPTLDWTKPNVS